MFGDVAALARVLHLRALVFAVWGAVHPLAPQMRDAPAIAWAIARAVDEDPDPVFGDAETEAAVAAYWALRESWLRREVVGDGGRSFGVWQEPRFVGKGPLRAQATYWLRLLHEGQRICPASPAAPLSGGCERAWKLADRRVAETRAILSALTRPGPEQAFDRDLDAERLGGNLLAPARAERE